MSNLMQLVENEETSEFYPTPPELVNKMLSGLNWDYVHTILEPSAGKGDILKEVARRIKYKHNGYDVDCIEIDPNLRQILKYNFSEERNQSLRERENELSPTEKWNSVTRQYEKIPSPNPAEYINVKTERECFFENGIHIVHDNFLTYKPYKRYDLIIMNPPFSNGDKHLLKAFKMQEKGGNIICLLNAETIKNPYTESRRELKKLLDEHNAVIEYIDNAFMSAERRTGVEVALIKVAIEQVEEESEIFNRMREAQKVEESEYEATELVVPDFIKAAISHYNIEVKAGIELIKQYKALLPYIQNSLDKEDKWKSPMLVLKNQSESGVTINEYLKDVRRKYWRALLTNPEFVGKLTSKLQSEYHDKVSKFADYDFTEFNIHTLYTEMNTQIKRGVEEEIIAMFDRLTAEHSYYPEFSKNRHYYDGWKTNKAHKIDKKVIIPAYGVFDSWDGRPRTYEARSVLEDIERILNFLDGNMTEEVNSYSFLKYNFKQGITKNIKQKYYTATFYKKGTVHLTFTCPELIERFNIYAAQYKNWLPPSYGKKIYSNMDAEEKAVIDSFQGEEAYNNVMEKSSYYLAPVTNNQMLMLGE